MKLAYEAPEIIYEDFSLSASSAAGCEFKTQLTNEEQQCGYMMEGDKVFAEGFSGCKYTPQPGDNTICYHNPFDGNNLYTS